MRQLFLGVFLMFIAPSAFSQSNISDIQPDRFRDVTSPFDTRYISYFFGPAPAPTGEAITLQTKGVLALSVFRSTTPLPQGARLELTMLGPKGVPLESFKFELALKSHLDFLKKITLAPDVESIRFKVVDHAEGGPTRGRPYAVLLEIWPLSTIAVLNRTDTDSLQIIPQASCAITEKPARRLEYLDSFDRISLGATPTGVSIPHLINAGAYLLIRVPFMAKTDSLNLNISAKGVGDIPFDNVCHITLTSKDSGKLLELQHPGLTTYSIWRIESLVPQSSTDQLQKAILPLIRERILHITPTVGADSAWNKGLGLLCFDRITQYLGKPNLNHPFAGRTTLDVKIKDVPGLALTQPQYDSLVRLVLQAASLWVRSCLTCKPSNLAVITVDGRTYTQGNFTFWLTPMGQEKRFPVKDLEELLAGSSGLGRIGTGVAYLPYKYIAEPKEHFKKICTARGNPQTPTLNDFQDALCKEKSKAESARVRISFTTAGTACGKDSEIVGCKADKHLTEYNAKNYRFVAPDGISIGTGAVDLDLLYVLTHEIGHWLGLPHIEGGDSIMADSVEHARCINFDTVGEMAKVLGYPVSNATKPLAFKLRATNAPSRQK